MTLSPSWSYTKPPAGCIGQVRHEVLVFWSEKKPAGGFTPKQPPAGYTGLVGMGCLYFKEDVEAAGIRNLREVWRVWRAGKNSKPAGGLESMARR